MLPFDDTQSLALVIDGIQIGNLKFMPALNEESIYKDYMGVSSMQNQELIHVYGVIQWDFLFMFLF